VWGACAHFPPLACTFADLISTLIRLGHALLNAEGIAALGFILLLFLRLRASSVQTPELPIPNAVISAALALTVGIAFWPNLHSPLLHDSYGLVYLPSRQSLADVGRLFYAHPTSGDFFFRPLSYLAYWFLSKWAHFDPFRWHLGSLIAHIANTLLVYALARQFSFPKFAAFATALLFALHGSRPEAVAWAASRVDLLATFFVLLTLLSIAGLLNTGQRRWYVPIAICTLCALLSKESAYCLPFLACPFLFIRGNRKRAFPVLVLLLVLCGAVFSYRFWVIGGIGGYGAASGHPTILHFSLLRTIDALFFRQWAILFFPINWSEPLGTLLWLALGVMLVLLIVLLFRPRANRRLLLAALAMTIAAALPVEHLLLIGSDLNGARVLYLPVLGWAFFWGILIQGRETVKAQALVVFCLLFFQAAALEHNLAIWREVASLGQQSCRFIAKQLINGNAPIAVQNLPAKWKGVYFLNNSFSACVLLNSGSKLQEPLNIETEPSTVRARMYRWDEATRQFQLVTGSPETPPTTPSGSPPASLP
jgi:hypothetical protein